MSIVGIGVDLVHLPRMKRLIETRSMERLAKRILCLNELTALNSIKLPDRQISFLATRWAAKEATYKALSGTIELSWKDIEVTTSSGRKPTISSVLLADRNISGWVSISHDGEYCIASCVFQKCS
jgi:holo-[acyl-carrier protein] synthase